MVLQETGLDPFLDSEAVAKIDRKLGSLLRRLSIPQQVFMGNSKRASHLSRGNWQGVQVQIIDEHSLRFLPLSDKMQGKAGDFGMDAYRLSVDSGEELRQTLNRSRVQGLHRMR